MIIAIYVLLTIVAFLVVLNGHLRGAKKSQIDVLLSLLLIALLIGAFITTGWKAGLFAIGIAFLSALITRPIAAWAASRLFALSSGASGRFRGLPPRPLERISQELGRNVELSKGVEELLLGGDRRTKAKNALLDYCEAQVEIREVMHEYQISRDDLEEIYYRLIAAGAGQWVLGHWVAASALAYPDTLRYVLARRGKDNMETGFNLITHFEQGTPLKA